MAFVVFNDGTRPRAIRSPEKANQIWQVLNGEVEAENEAQALFVASIQRIYLNRVHAPASYLKMYPDINVPDSYASTLGVRK